MSNMEKVPSVQSYTTPTRGEAQWGTDLSEEAITMLNQKLELEQQSNKIDELDLTLYVLRGAGYLSFEHIQKAGPNPDFSCKPPEEIVKDISTTYSGVLVQRSMSNKLREQRQLSTL